MKKEKDKKKVPDKPIVLIGNTYNKAPNPWLILAVKIVLCYFLSVGTMLCFIRFYNIPYRVSSVLQLDLLFTLAFFPLVLMFKKRVLLPVMALGAGAVYLFCFDSINPCIVLLKDYICIHINGRLLDTKQFVPENSYAYLTRTQNFIFGINLSMLILMGVVCFLMVLFSSKKFRPIPVIITWCVLYIPSFLGEKADYTHFIILLFISFFGLFTMSGDNLHSETPNNSTLKDNKKKRSVLKSITDTLIKYGRNVTNGIIAVILSAGVLLFSQYIFPDMSAIDTKEIVNSFIKTGEFLGEFFTDLFSGNSLSPEFNGYFSYDTFRYSNSIELNAPNPNDKRVVMKITGSSPESFYLSGDIGVEFDGKKWISISKYAENGKIAPDKYLISDSFDPDFMTEQFKTAVLFYDNADGLAYSEKNNKLVHFILNNYDNREYYYHNFFDTYSISQNLTKYNSVSIEYMMNSKTVFRPVKSINNAYTKDDSLIIKGDRIIKTANLNDYIKTFATTVSINDSSPMFIINDLIGIDEQDIKTGMLKSGYTYNEALQYIKDVNEYTKYVRDTYLDVPDSEKVYIDTFLEQFKADNPELISLSNDYLTAYFLCNYIRDNFNYSLVADNSPQKGETSLGRFLFETKQGHCAMYATAMTLALREMGIPARYITGFSTGELKQMPDGSYQKEIFVGGLHAWVEVYFDNIGWITFDPTGFTANDSFRTDNEETSAPETTVTTTVTTTTSKAETTPLDTTTTTTSDIQTTPKEETTENTDNTSNNPSPPIETNSNLNIIPLLIIIGITGLIVCLIVYLYIRFKKIPDTPTEKIKAASNKDYVRELYILILKMLKLCDITIAPSELPSVFANRVDTLIALEDTKITFSSIIGIIEEAEFSQNEISDDDKSAVEEYALALYRLLLNSCGKFKRLYLKITLC